MKTHRIFILTLAFVVSAVCAFSQAVRPKHYKQLQYPKMREIQIPDPARFELSNGMVVYLLEDHNLPVINGSVMVKTGSRYEPGDKVGLASMTGQVMRTGGTASKTGDEIDEMLERVGASVETFIGTSSGGANLSVLREDIDLGLSILADLLRNPAFREDKIDLAKIGARSGISRRNDQVGAIIGREFTRLIYGPNHPYARLTEYATVENITKQDMVDFHKKYFVPNGIIVAFWGDFKTDELKSKIEKTFSDWPRQEVNFPPVPEPRMTSQRSVNFIKKDDVNQSQIGIGHLGGLLKDPESSQLNLADQAFGGAFASRLFKKVRSEEGLAYSVFSFWGESWDYPGIFRMGGSTKSSTTVKMVRSILREFDGVVKNGVTDDELKFAKESFLNSYVFQFDTKGEIINRLMTLEFYGYPKDYTQKQQREVQAATKQSVNEAIAKRWNPGALTMLVVGKDADFDEPMSALGSVRTVDIAIPSPPEKIPDATPETISKGKEVLKKSLAAFGGGRVLAMKDMAQSSQMTMNTPMGEMSMEASMTWVAPNKVAQTMKTQMGEMASAFDGEKGWMKSPMGTQDLPASQKEELTKQIAINVYTVLRSIDNAEYVVQYLKDDKVNDKPAQVVFVKHNPTNSTLRLFIDPQTSLVVKRVYRGRTMQGPADTEEMISDYRDVSGVMVPHKIESFANGQKQSQSIVNSVKINSGVSEDVFKKPQ
ncbi:MAG: insulinase family protein [Ignavibacteriales bacterium]|nr:insulinase family protein [Ignavibacteriales bacterium]